MGYLTRNFQPLQAELNALARERGWRWVRYGSWRTGPWTVSVDARGGFGAFNRKTGLRLQFSTLEELGNRVRA